MTDTSLELREQLLPEQTGGHSNPVSEQVVNRDTESTQRQRVDAVASHPDPPFCFQPFAGFKIPEWPDHPLPLTQTYTTKLVSIALDSALLIFALLFLALAIGALAVSGKGIGDKSGRLIEQASRLEPTVFPIVFAALVGRALKTIGRFKSEKGIQVSVGRTINTTPPNATICSSVMLTSFPNRRSGPFCPPRQCSTLSSFSGQSVPSHYQQFSWAFSGLCLQLEAKLL